ncbi:hypothetical protein SSP35_20_00270 [Streptomyces sp. NBRC 110611]|uniref:hypothetical protein n=1 Tax=Streptomyces sp. NBRC 110611 TaxID=1621259 RepID=UPI00082B820A|nr:hypothetical protein [Streptomyces sp. NBRC 110611]GAU70531.1 hypothetical protein SSP35_20_00270 [Streptomyces sp. NBRC 110611]
MGSKSVVMATGGTVAVLGIAAAIAVPAAKDWFDNRHQETASYASGAEAKKDRPSVPRWLPDDASSIQYAMKTTGGERLVKATLKDGKLPSVCRPAKSLNAPSPEIEATWFPKAAAGNATARCDQYYAYTDGSTLYAWQINQDWLDRNKE